MMNTKIIFNYLANQRYEKAPKYDQGLDFLYSYKEKHRQKYKNDRQYGILN